MAKYVCSVCGYVHEGDSAPEKCPVCRVPADLIELGLQVESQKTVYYGLCNACR